MPMSHSCLSNSGHLFIQHRCLFVCIIVMIFCFRFTGSSNLTLVTMRTRRLYIYICICITFLQFIPLYIWRDEIFGIVITFTDLDMESLEVRYKKPISMYAVNVAGCRIMELDPFDPVIRKFLKKPRRLKCDFVPPLAAVNKSLLYIDNGVLKSQYGWQMLHYCTYEAICRPAGKSDDAFSFKEPVTFRNNVTLRDDDDLLRVKCYNRLHYNFYTDYITAVVRRNRIVEACEKRQREFRRKHRQQNEGFNVVMLGVDSVSRSNSIRQLSKTRDYLFNQLGAVELKGYHKVGENTFPNVVAILSGDSESELLNGTSVTSVTFERYDFLWKQFSRAGFQTLYAEDMPALCAFNYLKRGFATPPTDYYMRPFNRATEGDRYGLLNTRSCQQSILHTDRLLHWLAQFSEEFRADRHFAFAFLTGVTHEDVNSAGYADWPLLKFLRRLRATGAFQRRTAFVLFSDHGMRFGPLRQTRAGQSEERLPFIALVLPEWFRQRHPQQWRNLQANVHRLTTPFDLHATMLHALHGFDLAYLPASRHGTSLLGSTISEARTCADVSVQPHWCMCNEQAHVNASSVAVTAAASAALDAVNTIVRRVSALCARLSLAAVTNALLGAPRVGAADGTLVYMITFRTRPGDALFEATVVFTTATSTYSVAPDISRINKYGNQSHCISEPVARKYCYCV